MKLSIFAGDIADAPADAVCTSTNPRLSLMMGTGASIRGRGGPEILRACEAVAPLPPGAVHATTAGELPHKLVLHCVASDTAHRSSIAIVQSCVANALERAQAAGCSSIAMPIFGTRHAHLRFDDAVRAMAQAALATPDAVEQLIFVTNDDENAEALRTTLENVTHQRVSIERAQEVEPEPQGYWSFSLDAD